MTIEELRIRFYALQKEYRQLMDLLTDKQFDKKYINYRGFDASPSYLIYQPKVLFLGYNPTGSKDWMLWDEKGNHKPLVPHTEETELMFFSRNGARKENAEWYKFNVQENNKLPRQMIDLMYVLASKINPKKDNEKGSNMEPYWAQSFKETMMYLNLYPVATKDGNTMISLFRTICKEKAIPKEWKNSEWGLRKYLIRIMHQMVKLIDPRLVVCMGSQTFHDYTYSARQKHLINEVFTNPNYNNIIGFSRKGSWDGNIPNIAEAIYQRAFRE